MLAPRLPDVFAAFEELLNLPVMGPAALEIWKDLNLDYLQDSVFGTLAIKAALTANDNQLHSAMLMAPVPPDLRIIVTMLTWPKPLSEVRNEAREQFLGTVGRFNAMGDFAGALQFELFLNENRPHELRMAWLPLAKKFDALPGSLRKSLLPWGTGMTASKVDEPLRVGGREIVELAGVTWDLSRAMDELRICWIGQETGRSFELREGQERVLEVVKFFNPAASKAGLSHSMPLSRFDDTWLHHNLENALRFNSLPATLKADLLRVWGQDARDRFAAAWALFYDAFPKRPAQELLNELIDAPLALDPQAGAEFTPRPVDVFISYAWSDKTRGARDIYEYVSQSGFSAWLDEEQRPGDSQLNDEIAAVMLRSKRIVICVSLEMLTRGGYALREVLLALSFVPERCIIARLDRNPLPQVFNDTRIINWFERDGPSQLAAALQQSVPVTAHPATQMLKLEGPIVDKLLALVKRSSPERRHFDAPNRRAEFLWRGKLCSVVSQAWKQYEQADWDGMVKAVSPDLLKWTALNGPAARESPTVLGGAIRLRNFLFKAQVQLGAQDDWKSHNHDAYDLLEEILNLDLELLRPLPEVGWLTRDCRLAHQDCLDALAWAQEWFRGWSPQTLVDICDVPSDSAATVEERLLSRMAVLSERMVALRAWQDTLSEPEPAPQWTALWTTFREALTQRLSAGVHPVLKEYFEELNRCISPTMVEELATAMADSAVESVYTQTHREELFFDLPDFRLRCVIHSRISRESKHAALHSFRGTVLNDLRGPGSEEADLSILFAIFTHRDLSGGDWGYGLYLNCAATEDPERAKRLPSVLLNPFLMADMLHDDERHALVADPSNEIYEEF